MKSKLFLMLGSFWIGYVSMVNSTKCMKATMEREKDSILTEKFKNELGVVNYLWNLVTGGNNDFEISLDDMKYLCACSLYKMNQSKNDLTEKKFEDILDQVKVRYGEIGVDVEYFLWNTKEYIVPALLCIFGDENVIITKGYEKKAMFQHIYDIYVGVEGNTKKGEFQAIIKNVDV